MTARSPRALRLAAHQVRYDVLGFARNRQAVFFTLLLPLLFLVILVEVFGDEAVGPDGAGAATSYVPGLSAMAVVAAAFVNLVVTITVQREAGILKRRRATPVPAWVLIVGRAVTVTLAACVTVTLVLAVGHLGYDVEVPPAAVPGVVLFVLTGAIGLSCLGYAFSTLITSPDSAQPMVQAVVLPLYFISGVFVPDAYLPGWLREVATFFPVRHLAEGLHQAMDPVSTTRQIAADDLGVLALWGVAGLGVALLRFAWTPRSVT